MCVTQYRHLHALFNYLNGWEMIQKCINPFQNLRSLKYSRKNILTNFYIAQGGVPWYFRHHEIFLLNFVNPVATGTGISININFLKDKLKINCKHLFSSCCRKELKEESNSLGSHKERWTIPGPRTLEKGYYYLC